jgi:hypothetical protein
VPHFFGLGRRGKTKWGTVNETSSEIEAMVGRIIKAKDDTRKKEKNDEGKKKSKWR